MTTAIQVNDLHYTYEGQDGGETHIVFDGLSLSIEQGSFVAVLGHNGCGKSTLAKHFNAILLPAGGSVTVYGMDTKDEEMLLAIRQHVGMVFQNPDNQIVSNVVEEDVAFAPENLGVASQEIRQRVDDALRAVGMYDYRTYAPQLLSGGQKQRVAIAGVLAMQPQCVVLDEPTAMLDPQGRREVLDTIERLNRETGMTVILITHHMDEAARADRVIAMSEGRIVADGTPQAVFAQEPLLRSVGLDVPQTEQLLLELKRRGVDIPTDALTPEACAQLLRQRIQRRAQGRNVGRRSAAAAAQNAHTLGSKAGQLPCKIFRLALILHPGACDHRVARVGHHCKRQLCLAKLLHQRTHGTGSRNAVQAHSIHCTAGSHAAHKLCAVTALAGVAVRQHCKGHQHKGIRHCFFDLPRSFGHTGIAAQRLKQKVLCTQCGKPLGKGRIDLCRRECLGVRGRAKIGKHGSAGLCSGLCSQFPAFVRHGLPHGVLRCCHARQAEGVGLDSIGTRFQIRAVHGQNAVRVQQVCLLTFLPGLCLIICTHAAIEQQRALF